MQKQVLKKAVMVSALFLSFSSFSSMDAFAKDKTEGSAGMSGLFEQYYNDDDVKDKQITSLLSTPVTIPSGIVIAKCEKSINIRKSPSTSSDIIGSLPKNAYGIQLEDPKDGFVKIKSGQVTGYVSTDYLYMGKEGYDMAEQLAVLKATITANHVNVRSKASSIDEDTVITEVSKGEDLIVLDENSAEVVNKDDPNAVVWVKVDIDGEEGYVAKNFVTLEYKWKVATKAEVVASSSLRVNIVTEAKKHLGLRYVWGGTSLQSGADCSGFVWAVYTKCGLSVNKLGLARTSTCMAADGKKVSMSTIKPGDLVFYGNSSGHVNHVAMYIGNGKIIHESGRREGCKISNISYRPVLAMRNYLD